MLEKKDINSAAFQFEPCFSLSLLRPCPYNKGNISVLEISKMTAIIHDDIVATLQSHGLLKYYRGKAVQLDIRLTLG